MLVCERDNSIVIGHQCGFHIPMKPKSVFKEMLDAIDSLQNVSEIVALLRNITSRSYVAPRTTAYHYMSADTLNIILKGVENDKFKLRFTRIDYMNDTMDGKEGYYQLLRTIEYTLKRTLEGGSELLQEMYNKLHDGFSKLLFLRPCTRTQSVGTRFMVDGELCDAYVCSLSLDPESIPLWRSYGSGFAESYAIGIRLDELAAVQVCCIDYDDYAQTGRFLPGKVISKIIEACKEGVIVKSDVSDIVNAIMEFFSAWSVSHKIYAWEHENEMRLVKFVKVGVKPEGYIVRNGVFRPYFDEKFDVKCVHEVIVGPMVERYNAARSIDEYMGEKGFGGGRDKLQVRCSVLPVRF